MTNEELTARFWKAAPKAIWIIAEPVRAEQPKGDKPRASDEELANIAFRRWFPDRTIWENCQDIGPAVAARVREEAATGASPVQLGAELTEEQLADFGRELCHLVRLGYIPEYIAERAWAWCRERMAAAGRVVTREQIEEVAKIIACTNYVGEWDSLADVTHSEARRGAVTICKALGLAVEPAPPPAPPKPELRPCPNCRNTKLGRVSTLDQYGAEWWQIKCEWCGMQGPCNHSSRENDDWNGLPRQEP